MDCLVSYTLLLADNALILGHRNSEWTGHGPILEQDIALSNISLDLIGQARNFYQYASRLIIDSGESPCSGTGIPAIPGVEQGAISEDTLAYLRDSRDFKNCLLTEQPNGDWGKTVLRQFFFSAYQFCLYGQLKESVDAGLAAIAGKSIKEVIYHLRWSSEWVIRLGDGTEESHSRMLQALDDLWPFTGELFVPADYELELAGRGTIPVLTDLKPLWDKKIREVLLPAKLCPTGDPANLPVGRGYAQRGGKTGKHTEHLGYLLAEMQFLQRAYPGCEW